MKILTEIEFLTRFGRAPENDDLDRVNCDIPGAGHSLCGICPAHDKPRAECNCSRIPTEPNHEHIPDYSDPPDLDAFSKRIEQLRTDALFAPSASGLDPHAEQHLLIALDLLSQAARNVTLASLHQAAGNAAPRHL